MILDKLLQNKRDDILQISVRYGAGNVRVFASVVRGQSGPESDVDFLVNLEEGRSLFDLGSLLMDWPDLLHLKIDVVTEKGLHRYIRDKVLQEARPL